MKAIHQGSVFITHLPGVLTGHLLVVALSLGLLANVAQAFTLAPGTNNPTYIPLDTFSFNDTNNWTSDAGYYPVSFTNLTASDLGDGSALVVNSTNPAWLQYNVVETNGATNLTVDVGSVTFWFAPAWASTNQGGSGPGEWGRLLEVGGYTPDSSFGLWSLYVDEVGANIYFSAQTNDFSSNFCTCVTAPIAWSTNYWHFIAFTYSATNTALYLDGVLATNGPPLTNYPGPLALANGFFVGSDSNGIYQAQGMIDDLETYSAPLDANTIAGTYFQSSFSYYGNLFNVANFLMAPSNPSTSDFTPDAITGPGDLQLDVNTFPCVFSSNSNFVWITNVTVSAASGAMNVTFTIDGGQPGYAYDVFATGDFTFTNIIGSITFTNKITMTNGISVTNNIAITNKITLDTTIWTWMGQGAASNTYTVPIIGSADAFIILGTPQDSDGADLTDAYQALVTHTPGNPISVDGILTGWEALLGLNPNSNNPNNPSLRANYGYTPADWLNNVTGAKTGTNSLDAEGNVLQVSQ
jgi:hypothetical protein